MLFYLLCFALSLSLSTQLPPLIAANLQPLFSLSSEGFVGRFGWFLNWVLWCLWLGIAVMVILRSGCWLCGCNCVMAWYEIIFGYGFWMDFVVGLVWVL